MSITRGDLMGSEQPGPWSPYGPPAGSAPPPSGDDVPPPPPAPPGAQAPAVLPFAEAGPSPSAQVFGAPPAQPPGAPSSPPAAAYGTPPGYPVPPPGYAPVGYPPPGYGPPPGYYPPPGYAPGPYAYPTPTPASMIVLVVLSAIAAASCYFSLAGIPAVILGAIALNTNRTDPQRAQHLARIGWIVFGGVTAFIVVAIVVVIAVGTSGG